MLTKIFKAYASASHKRRASLLSAEVALPYTASILDLGGGDGGHLASIFPMHSNVTVFDLDSRALEQAKRRGFRTVLGDGTRRLPFRDKEFDFCFCNSVIEHVTGSKEEAISIRDGSTFSKQAWIHQQHFASEVRRVSNAFCVQTPNRFFWIESHTWLPGLIVALPRQAQISTIQIANRFMPKKATPDWNLLTEPQLRILFPDAKIVRERSLGMTKSLMAIRS